MFRNDVVRVAANRIQNTTISEVAKDCGIHDATLRKWMRQTRIDVGAKQA